MAAAARGLTAPAIPELVEIDRELCGRGLYPFIQRAWKDAHVQPVDFVGGWHLGMECEYLEAFVDGEIPVLLINVPPGHMKSLSCSVFLQPWVWGPRGMPHKRFVNTSYRKDLAFRDAYASRELIRSPWYRDRWGDGVPEPDRGHDDLRVIIRKDQDAVHRFTNTLGGYRFSCPVAGIMGEGGDYVCNDDPHNVEQAESDHVRDETVRRLSLAMPTRVRSEDGGYLVIMQRLHTRDYSGHILAEELGAVHLCLPARFEYDHPCVTTGYTLDSGRELSADRRLDWGVYERYCELAEAGESDLEAKGRAALFAAKHNGELLWPEFYGEERVAKLESSLTDYGAAGQLQQRPTPREGGIFRRAWFEDNMIDAKDLPRDRVVVRGWDPAGSTRKKSPFSAGVRMSRRGNVYYVEHVVRERWEAGAMEENVRGVAKTDGKAVIIDFPQDPGQAGKSQVKALAQILAGYVIRTSPESGDKVQRAETFAAQCYHGNVKFVTADWNDAYIDELTSAGPAADYMDQTDASSRAFGRLLSLGRRASSGVSSGSY